jgi:hypothetical protein
VAGYASPDTGEDTPRLLHDPSPRQALRAAYIEAARNDAAMMGEASYPWDCRPSRRATLCTWLARSLFGWRVQAMPEPSRR